MSAPTAVEPRQRCRHGASCVDHAEVLVRARAGDDGAFDELVRRFRPLVRGTAARHGASPSEADDIAQDVWMTLWLHLHAIRSPECLPGWLRQVTISAAFRQHRATRRTDAVADMPEHLEDAARSPIDHVIVEGDIAAARAALGTLDERERTLIGLLMEDRRPDYARISTLVGRPVGSIGPTRERILRRLRTHPAIGAVA